MADGTLDEPSLDNLSSGSGTDVIVVDKPAVKDVVSCGPGFDRAIADRKDVGAADCEKVTVVHGTLDEVFQQQDNFFNSIPPSFFEGQP